MASKRPAYQWYPGDARRDTALQSCRLIARGLWREMLDLMHDGEPYGHLTAGGVPIATGQLARLVGEPAAKVRVWLAELEDRKVFSRTEEDVIYSRRMVKDERLRNVRAACGSMSKDNPNVPRAKADKDGQEDILPMVLNGGPSGDPLQFAVAVAVKKQPSGKPGWVPRFGKAWTDRFGGTANHGRIGKAIKPLIESSGEDAVFSSWESYLASKPPEFASPEDFANKYGLYSGAGTNGKHDPEMEELERIARDIV